MKQAVRLRWLDASHQHPDTWIAIRDLDKKLVPIETVGLLLLEDDTRYVIAHTFDKSNKNACGIFHVPKSAVIKIEYL